MAYEEMIKMAEKLMKMSDGKVKYTESPFHANQHDECRYFLTLHENSDQIITAWKDCDTAIDDMNEFIYQGFISFHGMKIRLLNNFSRKLVELYENGLTKKQVLDIFGIPRRTQDHWENGDRIPPEWQQPIILYALENTENEQFLSELKKYKPVD